MGIKSLFYDKDWAEVNEQRVPYNIFLYNLSGSKFMICPVGNAIDCHRNRSSLYEKSSYHDKRSISSKVVEKLSCLVCG